MPNLEMFYIAAELVFFKLPGKIDLLLTEGKFLNKRQMTLALVPVKLTDEM